MRDHDFPPWECCCHDKFQKNFLRALRQGQVNVQLMPHIPVVANERMGGYGLVSVLIMNFHLQFGLRTGSYIAYITQFPIRVPIIAVVYSPRTCRMCLEYSLTMVAFYANYILQITSLKGSTLIIHFDSAFSIHSPQELCLGAIHQRIPFYHLLYTNLWNLVTELIHHKKLVVNPIKFYCFTTQRIQGCF